MKGSEDMGISTVTEIGETRQFIIILTPDDAYAIMERARAVAEAAGMTPDEWRAVSRGDGRGGTEHDIGVLLGLTSLRPLTAA